MKTAVGNHVGLVVNTNDPENRGRVQVYIPHISTTLYNNWNEKLENIEFKTFEESIFDSEIKERLLSLLPWAEAAVPIWGGGTGAPVNTDTGEPTPFPTDQSFSYQGATADYKKLFAPNKSDAGLSETMKASLGGFAANFPNAIITSAKRDYVPEGGSQTSLHLSGNAIDVAMPASPVEQERIVNWWMTQGGATEIGWEGNHIHVGFRQDGSKSVFWRNSPSESVKTNLAGSPSWFENIGNQYKNGTLQRYAQAPKTNEPVSGKVSPIEIENDGFVRSDGAYTGETLNYSSTEIGDTKSMSPAFKTQYERVLNSLNGSKFDPASNGGKYIIPDDGKTYGITTGSKEEWAHLFTRMASVESSFNPQTTSGPSYGLYQMGNDAWRAHGKNGNIYNPDDNTKSFINYSEDLYFGSKYGGRNKIAFQDKSLVSSWNPYGWGGISTAYGPVQRASTGNFLTNNEKQLLAENMKASEKANGTYTGGSNGNKLFRTTNQLQMATGSVNAGRIGGPAGMFSCPAVGAKVWVFFQAENPQRPVYFANVYEPSNAAAAGMTS
jgi:hypothetical protein